MSVFDKIYSNNSWGFGSGHGSLPRVTKGYRDFLEMFISENNIKTVVDFGCGDWQFSKFINWQGAKYIGLDVVPSVVKANKEKYQSREVTFKVISGLNDTLPKGDLLIVKDVIQHWSNKGVAEFLKKVVPKYRYALITNCIIPVEDINKNIVDGEFRPLDIRQKPFNTPATIVYAFDGPKTVSYKTRKLFPAWRKAVMLVDQNK